MRKMWWIIVMGSLCTPIVHGDEKPYTPLPKPGPVPPPRATGHARNPMVLLSEAQNYSAARVSSYERHGQSVFVLVDKSKKEYQCFYCGERARV